MPLAVCFKYIAHTSTKKIIKNQNRNLRNLKTKKIFQKSFLPVTYISSHHFQKRKKMYSRLLPPPLKKSKTYLLQKRKIPKKNTYIFPSLFFLSFFSVKSPYYK